MILQKKVVVVMPAYNAGKTLETTVAEIDRNSSTRLSWWTTRAGTIRLKSRAA